MPMTDEQKKEWAKVADNAYMKSDGEWPSETWGDVVEAVAPLIRRAALEEAAAEFTRRRDKAEANGDNEAWETWERAHDVVVRGLLVDAEPTDA